MLEFGNFNDELYLFLHVAGASVLAGIVGLEREVSQKPAGFRTHLIIGGVAALMILVGDHLVKHYAETASAYANIKTDPLRIINAIIVGVSFIGAGTILKSDNKDTVRFLTTAASTLLSAGIGITVAVKLYYLAIGLTLFTLLITIVFGKLEKYMVDKLENT